MFGFQKPEIVEFIGDVQVFGTWALREYQVVDLLGGYDLQIILELFRVLLEHVLNRCFLVDMAEEPIEVHIDRHFVDPCLNGTLHFVQVTECLNHLVEVLHMQHLVQLAFEFHLMVHAILPFLEQDFLMVDDHQLP